MTTYTIGLFPSFVYIISSFVANAGVSITGFGMALIFVFVVTLFDVMDSMKCTPSEICDMKHTVFLQSLSLAGSVPFLMYKAKIHKHAHKGLLSTLIPVTLVSTPAGQYLQQRVSSSWICIVVGLVVSGVVGWKLVDYLRHQQRQYESTTPLPSSEHTKERSPLVIVPPIEGSEIFYGSTAREEKAKEEKDPTIVLPVGNHGGADDDENRDRSLVLWGMVLGFASGFLGGLIGMRGPPLMIFFLVFPFPKTEARAVGAIMLFLNMLLRIGYYWLDDRYRRNNYDENDTTIPWFLWSSSWQLYLGVFLAGILGVPIGDWVHHRIDQNKFKVALGVLLSASGVVNIAKGVTELSL